MRMQFERDRLSRFLPVLDRVLPKKSALPFYQALYIGCVEGGVEFRVTNGDQYLSLIDRSANWEADEPGFGVALPGEEFLRAVRVAPGSSVVVSASSDSAQVASGGADWALRYLTGISWSDAPEPLDEGPEASAVISGGRLLSALRKVQYAVSRTQNRPSFQQVMVGEETVAADGRRAHVVSGLDIEGSYLIPESVVEVVLDLLDLIGDEEFRLEMGEEGWVRLRSEDVTFTTGRLAYEYPDVLSVMVAQGREQEGRIKVSRQEMVSAVTVADTAQDEGAVRLAVTKGRMHVEAESAHMRAQMEFDVETENLNGRWERWFPAELLLEMLGAFDSEYVEFRLMPSGAQGVLYVEDGQECSVLMPLLR